MATKTQICQLALRHLAITERFADVDTANTKNAKVLLDLYDQVVGEVLSAFDWPFARRFAQLVAGVASTETGWATAYTLPNDAVTVHRVGVDIVGGTQIIPEQDIPFEINEKLLYSNIDTVAIQYTSNAILVANYPPDFIACVADLLAFYAAPSLTEGDQFKLGARAFQMYQVQLVKSKVKMLNEQAPQQPVDSEFERSRAL